MAFLWSVALCLVQPLWHQIASHCWFTECARTSDKHLTIQIHESWNVKSLWSQAVNRFYVFSVSFSAYLWVNKSGAVLLWRDSPCTFNIYSGFRSLITLSSLSLGQRPGSIFLTNLIFSSICTAQKEYCARHNGLSHPFGYLVYCIAWNTATTLHPYVFTILCI